MLPTRAAPALVLLLVALPTASAQAADDDASPFELPVALQWLFRGPVEAATAIVLGALVGALITTFSFLGGDVPGTPGGARLKTRRAEIATQRAQAYGLLHPTGDDADQQAVLADLTQQEKALGRDQWLQYVTAGILYVLVGVGGALLLASNVLEAIGLGLGGPAALGGVLKARAERAVSDLSARLTAEAHGVAPPAGAAAPPVASGIMGTSAYKLQLAQALRREM